MWNASHLVVRLCALRHWKRVSMPPTTNQRDGSFGMPLAYTNQKNRPFGLCRGNLYIISKKNRDCLMMRQSRFSSI